MPDSASYPLTEPLSKEAAMAMPGRKVFLGNLTVAENVLLSLSAGNKRKVFDLPGVVAGEALDYAALSPCEAGCEALNVYATAAGKVTFSYSTPTLGIGSVINIPIAVYRIT